MATELALDGQKILLTRPQAQALKLTSLIEQSGGEAIRFPVISIEPLPRADWGQFMLQQADWLIFVSRNAVACFLQGWHKALPAKLQLAAVGNGTASAMREAGLMVDCQPDKGSGSEALMQTQPMQRVHGKQFVIVKGVGGREWLADTLIERGATIDYLEVYRRVLLQHGRAACIHAMYADKVICTSIAGVDNLCHILAEFREQLFCKPLVVVSERIAEHARSMGFSWVEVSADASDDAVLKTMIGMDKQHGKR